MLYIYLAHGNFDAIPHKHFKLKLKPKYFKPYYVVLIK